MSIHNKLSNHFSIRINFTVATTGADNLFQTVPWQQWIRIWCVYEKKTQQNIYRSFVSFQMVQHLNWKFTNNIIEILFRARANPTEKLYQQSTISSAFSCWGQVSAPAEMAEL